MTRLLCLLICCLSLLITGCSRESVEQYVGVSYKTTNRFAKNLAPLPGQFEKDIDALNQLIGQFTGNIEVRWGENQVFVSGKRDYVKYTDNYKSRARIDFERGVIQVETVATDNPKSHLKQAIITTLLTPQDPASVDLYSAAEVPLEGRPFLEGQVVDHEGKAISWQWRANRFAEYLLDHRLKKKQVRFQNMYYVTIPMVSDHVAKRSYQYADIVRRAAKRYDISEQLIYAIIKTESSFNPYAVSWANAYGLMQVVPKTAGRDVFKLVKKRPGQPTPKYLFDPEKNIDTGTAYFYILKNRYLKAVRDPLSLHYSMISAYNGGTGNVLRTFDRNRDRAMRDLNSLKPNQVFWALTHRHPSSESRRYLQKVTRYQKEFANLPQ
ncbi:MULTISPECIES: membrane-bound lytic murein transglycosylase MltC [Salinivibrio]|uniref:Membrane-bound lytic murein transglycosylase MltC n=1 Tax=Salinivibrio costicola TaxID=51367 RepID=A0ABX6K1C1_SALCS|nr:MULTISPECIES: membrane-bound lytic murein transglycosylase MltC [Salinivibrio]ODQ00227.1 lytic murein transglycosylase [Salinivibrio sp. DV]PCE68912.1 murein transglycosylase C [Salinivibrio sp. YCSC6]QCF36658.1 membrane-bound lytic murein transglycosylase MltC [Salinivibrio sp. YCSC6]QIR05369.1 membrane-bound lytic murein transglycosylase MltC [Salinivibrio costicola]